MPFPVWAAGNFGHDHDVMESMVVFRTTAWLSFGVLLILTACTTSNTGDESLPTSSTSIVPTTTLEPVATTEREHATSTTESRPEIVSGSLPIDAEWLVYGDDGIIAIGPGGDLVRITDNPTAIAFAVGDSLIVSQSAMAGTVYPPRRAGPIIVMEPTGETALVKGPDEELRLFDVGVIDGAATAVVTAVTGDGPEDFEERLFLFDLATGQRRDLGMVGAWEATLEDARLADGLIVVKPYGQSALIIARDIAGNLIWSVEADGDEFEKPGHLLVADDRVMLVESRFEGGDFTPILDIVEYDAATGRLVSSDSLTLDAEFGGGFCLVPHWKDGLIICDESYGGPFSLDPTTGSIEPLTTLDDGIAVPVIGTQDMRETISRWWSAG